MLNLIQFMILLLFILFGLFESYLFRLSQSFKNNRPKYDDLDSVDMIKLSQSEECSPEDDIKRIQCFRELPNSKYEVFEGEDVLMRCRVAYQKGKVQWAFKGKMLGFDRGIPNYPRMRMPGNVGIGDHSLFIENVKVSDSGNYECQLSPSSDQPPRRRLTKLLILKAPIQPAIYRNGILSKTSILVSIKKEESPYVINLTCVAQEGNPSPTFEWNVDYSKRPSALVFRLLKTQIAKLNESASLLSLRSDQIENNDIIICRVFNAATNKRLELTERILYAEVRVVKRILPGSLLFKEIPPNSYTITLQEKEPLRLSCLTNDPGDPPIKLHWVSSFYKDPINENMVTNVYKQQFSQSSIIIPAIDSSWHRKSLTCSGTQEGIPATKPISTIVLVKHLPNKMVLTAASISTNDTFINPNIIYCKQNQMVKLICSTNTFFLQNLKIVWFVKLTEESEWQKVARTKEKIIEIEDSQLQVLESVLDVSPSLNAKNILKKETSRLILQVICVMKSSDTNSELRKQVKLETYELPSKPVITINNEKKSTILTNGQSIKIQCSVNGGHPVPGLHLMDENGREIKAKKYTQLNMTILEYNIEVKHRDNNKKLRCITSSKASIDSVSLSSDLVILNVAIPPKLLTMKRPLLKFGYQAYQYISYNCFTDSSFPQAKIEWWLYHSCKLEHIKLSRINQLSSSDLQPFCESELIKDKYISHFDPLSQSTMSTLTIKLLPSYDHTFIECSVAFYPKWNTLKNKLSKISQLRVQYRPQFTNKLPKIYTVEEGQNMSITINTSANPAINGYTWLVNKKPITRKSKIELKISQFSVLNAEHDMMGNYTLQLENQLGQTSLSFFLNVTFAPKLLGQSVQILKINPFKGYKQKVIIMCSAQANPFREQAKVQWIKEPPLVFDQNQLVDTLKGNSFFSSSNQIHCSKDHWGKGNVTINCISLGTIEIVSSLQILPVDYRYIGSYKCIFSSNIKSSSASKTTHLIFPTMPLPIKNPRKSEYVVKMGGKTEIACYFIAFPDPTIIWIRSPNIICSENTIKYATSISTPQAGLVKAVLAIRETNNTDIGTYICSAQNQHGKSTNSIFLGKPRAPTQPFNVTLVNVSDTSITLGWISGFNGGSKQTIELRWRVYDIGQDIEYNFMEFQENEESDIQFYIINDLQNQKKYEILIQATNRYSNNDKNPIQMFVETIKYESEDELIQSDSRKFIRDNKDKSVQEKSNAKNILIIILLSTIGGILVSLKIGLITYCLRRQNKKYRKSMNKISSSPSQRLTDGYPNSADSMELRATSLVRSGFGSTMYAQSISDHLSQNGSDNGLKLNFYKTGLDEFQSTYVSPELEMVTSANRSFGANGVPPNFYPAYIQLSESSSLIGYPEPYFTGYYSYKPIYNNKTPNHITNNNQNHFDTNTNVLTKVPISLNFQKIVEANNYPSSAVSSGDSTCSHSPNRKYIGYLPLVEQSGAPSTAEEYLSSVYSNSEYHKIGPDSNDEDGTNPMVSFRLNQKDYYNGPSKKQTTTQESIMKIPSRIMSGLDYQHMNQSMNSENEQILKASQDFLGSNIIMSQQKDNFISKLNKVDLITHSSPSVIRISSLIYEKM